MKRKALSLLALLLALCTLFSACGSTAAQPEAAHQAVADWNP